MRCCQITHTQYQLCCWSYLLVSAKCVYPRRKRISLVGHLWSPSLEHCCCRPETLHDLWPADIITVESENRLSMLYYHWQRGLTMRSGVTATAVALKWNLAPDKGWKQERAKIKYRPSYNVSVCNEGQYHKSLMKDTTNKCVANWQEEGDGHASIKWKYLYCNMSLHTAPRLYFYVLHGAIRVQHIHQSNCRKFQINILCIEHRNNYKHVTWPWSQREGNILIKLHGPEVVLMITVDCKCTVSTPGLQIARWLNLAVEGSHNQYPNPLGLHLDIQSLHQSKASYPSTWLANIRSPFSLKRPPSCSVKVYWKEVAEVDKHDSLRYHV